MNFYLLCELNAHHFPLWFARTFTQSKVKGEKQELHNKYVETVQDLTCKLNNEQIKNLGTQGEQFQKQFYEQLREQGKQVHEQLREQKKQVHEQMITNEECLDRRLAGVAAVLGGVGKQFKRTAQVVEAIAQKEQQNPQLVSPKYCVCAGRVSRLLLSPLQRWR